MLTDKKFTFRIRSVLKLSWGEGAAYAAGRDFHALSIRIEGNADFIHGDRRYHVGRGEMLYVPAGCDYRIEPHERETVIAVHFDVLDAEHGEIETFRPKNPEIMTDLFYKMYRAWRAKEVGYEYRIDSLLSRVLEGMVAERFNERHGIRPDFLTLLGFLHANFTDPSLTVESLAKRMSVSTTYLRHLFCENFGVSPIKYLTRLRIDYATRLLESGYYTVEEVAKLSGYVDPKYFSTVYKRNTGASPKKRMRESGDK